MGDEGLLKWFGITEYKEGLVSHPRGPHFTFQTSRTRTGGEKEEKIC